VGANREDNLCINTLCKVCQVVAYHFLQLPLVAAATQQCYEHLGRREEVAQFHVGMGDMCLTLYPQVSLIIFS